MLVGKSLLNGKLQKQRRLQMDRDELERKRREMELLLANESQMSHDEKTRILLKLLDFVEEELVTGDD